MIYLENHLGSIRLSRQYLIDVITHTVTNCVGVVGVTARNNRQVFLRLLTGDNSTRNFKIKYNKQLLELDLHLLLSCGVNISETVRSLKHKLRYTLEELTELEIGRINIFVDGIKNETGE